MEKAENFRNVGIPELKNWFESYISNYKIEDPTFQYHIDLKHTHTLNVCQNCVQIGVMLNLDFSILRMLWAIGLFHDIARFPQ